MTQPHKHQEEGCPGIAAMRLLEQKWSLQILKALADGRKRFCQLQDTIGTVNSVTLTRRLREMEQQGILVREVRNAIPPWVEYELTEKGHDLNAVVEAIHHWGRKWAPVPAHSAAQGGVGRKTA